MSEAEKHEAKKSTPSELAAKVYPDTNKPKEEDTPKANSDDKTLPQAKKREIAPLVFCILFLLVALFGVWRLNYCIGYTIQHQGEPENIGVGFSSLFAVGYVFLAGACSFFSLVISIAKRKEPPYPFFLVLSATLLCVVIGMVVFN